MRKLFRNVFIKLSFIFLFYGLFDNSFQAQELQKSDRLDKNLINKELRISAAANLRNILDEMIQNYKTKDPSVKITVTYGSSGTLTQQIINGANFDLFFSADTYYPEQLKKKGYIDGEIQTYAYGRVVLWGSMVDVTKGLDILLSPQVKKIAIANPNNAPYGRNTVKMLQKTGFYDKVKDKIIQGENISQSAQYAFSGNAEVCFTALSLILVPEMMSKGKYFIPSEDICEPIEQAFVILKKSKNKQIAQNFSNYLLSLDNKSIWERYGYKTIN